MSEKKQRAMPIEVMRQQLQDDPDVDEMAKIFGVTKDEYIELVLEYAKDPEKEPEMHLLDDDEWHESGVDVATSADVKAWFNSVLSGEISLEPEQEKINDRVSKTFDQEKLKQAAGLEVNFNAPKFEKIERKVVVQKDNPMGSVLKNQLLQQRSRISLDAARVKNKKPRNK